MIEGAVGQLVGTSISLVVHRLASQGPPVSLRVLGQPVELTVSLWTLGEPCEPSMSLGPGYFVVVQRTA